MQGFRITKDAYIKNGTVYPRVSRIVDIIANPELERWRHKIGVKQAACIAKEAAQRGEQVHHLIAKVLNGEMVSIKTINNDQVRTAFVAWQDWFRTHAVRPKLVEHTVFNEEPPFAGTLDMLDETLTLTDWKTTRKLNFRHWLQGLGYACALRAQNIVCPRLRLVRLDPNIEIYDELIIPIEDTHIQMFLNLAGLWHWITNHKEDLLNDSSHDEITDGEA